MHLVLLHLLNEVKYNMLGKGGCTTTHFQLIICTFFQQHSILYSVVEVKGVSEEIIKLNDFKKLL